jgi:hypothetical protein
MPPLQIDQLLKRQPAQPGKHRHGLRLQVFGKLTVCFEERFLDDIPTISANSPKSLCLGENVRAITSRKWDMRGA